MNNDEKRELIKARLSLAQSILEESDLLGQHESIEDIWDKHHPRHEREALVVYLLLTCFDLLGQSGTHQNFISWMASKSSKTERDRVLSTLHAEATYEEAALALARKHNDLYGVRNSFCQGINNLIDEEKAKLLSSVDVSVTTEHGKPSDVQPRFFPIEDPLKKERLKFNYLYSRRNSFTHKLKQHYRLSQPTWNRAGNKTIVSWSASIRDGKLYYPGFSQDFEKKENEAFLYTTYGWPFVLFEVLYQAIGIKFSRTEIKLRFAVQLISHERPGIIGNAFGVEHSLLKDSKAFAERYWTSNPRVSVGVKAVVASIMQSLAGSLKRDQNP